jgi:serine/threonine-protein kinase
MSPSSASTSTSTESSIAQRPAAAGLAALTALGVAHALWTLFQWTQLVAARTGGQSFCGFGDAASQACTAVWDSELASTVQAYTALPVAGWGLVWSLVAIALPLSSLAVRAAEAGDGSASHARGKEARLALWPATRLTGLAGLAVVAALLLASALAGRLCTSCAVTYMLVTAYAAVCLRLTPLRGAGLLRGVTLATGAVALAFVLLYVPGLRTPRHQAGEGVQVLQKLAAERAHSSTAAAPSSTAAAPGADVAQPAHPSDLQAEASIRELLSQFGPETLQNFSDALDTYARTPVLPRPPPRALIGRSDAPVQITEFSDALCGHCADLHEAIVQIRAALPPDSFSIEPRQFPLDSSCNAELTGESTSPVRCVAARAQICLEGEPDAFDFSGSLFLNQRGLDEGRIYELAAPIMPHDELSACIRAAATEEKLKSDIAWATEHDIQGTPLVLLNGRETPAFPPLLYALILARGDARHPAFAALPPPQVAAP